MEAMARSVGDEGEYESGIAWMERALEALYKTPSGYEIDAFLLAHIARWRQNLGDHAGALETAKTFVPTPNPDLGSAEQSTSGVANSLHSGHGKRTELACPPLTRTCIR